MCVYTERGQHMKPTLEHWPKWVLGIPKGSFGFALTGIFVIVGELCRNGRTTPTAPQDMAHNLNCPHKICAQPQP